MSTPGYVRLRLSEARDATAASGQAATAAQRAAALNAAPHQVAAYNMAPPPAAAATGQEGAGTEDGEVVVARVYLAGCAHLPSKVSRHSTVRSSTGLGVRCKLGDLRVQGFKFTKGL